MFISENDVWLMLQVGLGVLIFLVFSLFLLTILKMKSKKSPYTSKLSLESDSIGPTNITKQIKTLKENNPTLSDTEVRLLLFARYLTTRDYKLYSANIGCNNESSVDEGEDLIIVKNAVKYLASPVKRVNFQEYFTKFDFLSENEVNFIKLTEAEQLLIQDNAERVNKSIIHAEVPITKELVKKLTEKSIQVYNEPDLKISPLDITFARFVIYFLLK